MLWPEGRYSLEVWHCWVRYLLQINPCCSSFHWNVTSLALSLTAPQVHPCYGSSCSPTLCCAASHVSGSRNKGISYQNANGIKRDFSEGEKMVAQETVSAQEHSLSPAEPWVLASQRFVGTCSRVLAKGAGQGGAGLWQWVDER